MAPENGGKAPQKDKGDTFLSAISAFWLKARVRPSSFSCFREKWGKLAIFSGCGENCASALASLWPGDCASEQLLREPQPVATDKSEKKKIATSKLNFCLFSTLRMCPWAQQIPWRGHLVSRVSPSAMARPGRGWIFSPGSSSLLE